MPGLLSKSALRSGGSGQYINLVNAQPQLPPTDTTSTGFTIVTDDKLITTYRSSLGHLEMNSGTIYSSTPDQSIKLVGTGTGTVLVLGGALSTSTNTGALQVIGGIATTQDIFVNGLTIGQGYQGVNNLVIRGIAQPIPDDANDGQESIAIGYNVLGGISSSRNVIAIGRGALSSGTQLVGQVAIGDLSLNSLGNFPVQVAGSITHITQASPAVVTVVGHGLSTGSVVTITGLIQGPVDLNNNNYYINVLSANTVALYSDDILFTPVDARFMPVYVDGGASGGTLSRVRFYDENTALGANTGLNLIEGRQNIFLGPRAGQFLTTGSFNVFIGHEDANNMITGDANISILGGRLVNGLNNQISIGSALYFNGTGNLSLLANTNVGLGTQSFGTTTGALVVSGGVGIQKDLWVGGTIHGSIDGASLTSALASLDVLSSTSTQANNILVHDTTSTMTYYVALVETKDGNYSPVDADAGVYYTSSSTTFTVPKFNTTAATSATSTATGDIVVSGGVGVGGSVYSQDGNTQLNGLLYTPRVLVGDFNVLTGINPNPGDFWIDILSQAQYQYINDGGQSYWLQIAIL
jgi:hypothetical protein